MPTVSTTWVASIAPTWAARSSDRPQAVAVRKPARKASPTPVGSASSRAGATGTVMSASPRREMTMPSAPCVTTRVPTRDRTSSWSQPVFSWTSWAS